MQDEHSIIGKIIAKYPDLSPEEKEILNEWLPKDGNRQIFDSLTNNETRIADLARLYEIRKTKETNREKYHLAIAKVQSKTKVVWWHKWQAYVAAASLIIIAGITYTWLGGKKHETGSEPTAVKVNDVKPGQFKARLTLDDSTVIILDNAGNGKLVQQGSTNVINKDGQLIYQPKGKDNKIFYNTLSTSKGETFATVLSDGTKVWLNSQSSIHYPVAFAGDTRQVEVTGEAFFEVAPSIALLKNGQTGKRPFVVNAPGQEVEVLGTHFNINSYADEETIKTTLLEGKVKVRSKANNAIAVIQPGEQAQINKQTQTIKTTKDVDVDAEVAWRYGYFQFNNADLPTVMRQLARWYDVEVVYEGSIPTKEVLGRIPRTLNLSEVLHVLKKLEVNFRIEGKKIIVAP